MPWNRNDQKEVTELSRTELEHLIDEWIIGRNAERDRKGVLFTSARKFKGLEADAIIIVDVDGTSFINDDSKRLFYVGSSRAKHQLDIVFIGGESDLKSVEKSLSDRAFPNAVIGVGRCLNVKPVLC